MRHFYQQGYTAFFICTGLFLYVPIANATVEYALESGLTWNQTKNPLLLSNKQNQYSLTHYDNDSGLFSPDDYEKYKSADSYWTHTFGAGFVIPLPTDRSYLQLVGRTDIDHGNTFNQLKNRNTQWQAQYHLELSSWFEASFSHNENRLEYSYFNGFPKKLFTYYNPQTNKRYSPSGSYLVEQNTSENQIALGIKVTPHWKIPFSVTNTQSKYLHGNDTSPYDSNTHTYTTGISYESGKGSVYTLGIKQSNVRFPNKVGIEFYQYNPVDLFNGNNITGNIPLDCLSSTNINNAICNATVAPYYTSYVDNEIFSQNKWNMGPNTVIRSNINFVNRKFNQGQQNHLYGILLNARWHYSPKTEFNVSVWNNSGTINDDDNYRTLQNQGIQLYVLWQATYKTSFTVMSSLYQEHYSYFNADKKSTISEKTRHLGFQYNYDITSNTRLSVFAHEQRTSGSNGALYKRMNLWAGITYTFENMQGSNRATALLNSMGKPQ